MSSMASMLMGIFFFPDILDGCYVQDVVFNAVGKSVESDRKLSHNCCLPAMEAILFRGGLHKVANALGRL